MIPRKMTKRTGMALAKGVFVLTAGIDCTIVLKVKKHTTTFLYCKKSAIGKNVGGV